MAQYRITYNQDLEKKVTIVIAESPEQALGILDINENDLIKIVREVIPASDKISLENQATILGAIYSAALSGQNISNALENATISLYPRGIIADKIDLLTKNSLSISESLEELKFNTTVVRLIDAGEMSGALDSGILEAEKYLDLDRDVKEISSSGTTEALPYLVIGMGLILFFPGVLGEVVENLINPEDTNFFTNMILFIYSNLTLVITGISIFLVVLVIVKLLFWDIVKNIYPFSVFEKLILLKNAIVFLSIYSTLERHGVEIRRILNTYKEVNDKIAEQLFAYINQGKGLSVAILHADFPESWARTVSSIIDFENREAKNKAIESLFTLLKRQINKQAEKVGSFITSAGKAILILAIIMIGVGFYFPAMISQL